MSTLPIPVPFASPRNPALDALRGLAILGMVLSGSIAFGGVLPAWMYHAQVPPPKHTFMPEIPGITWVDLVFPFFLFSMGAAMPLSLQKYQGQPAWVIIWVALRRMMLLAWFALFTYHMRAWVISPQPQAMLYATSILAFALLFVQLYRPPKAGPGYYLLQAAAYLAAFALLWLLPFNNGQGFMLAKSDIILLVLANMAFFGTLLYWLTRHHPWGRLLILPLVAAIFLSSKAPDTWQQWLFNASPLPWLYKFYYLKYLFLIIPGTWAGEWMLRYKSNQPQETFKPWLVWVLAAIIITNVTLLFARHLLLNLLITAVALVLAVWAIHGNATGLIKRLVQAGAYLLVLGLCIEATEGGIKKDPSTYSYYFVTSGLAMLLLALLHLLQNSPTGRTSTRLLATNGQNPMVAYVAGNLLLTPALHLTGIMQWHNQLTGHWALGLLKGLLFTSVVFLITWLFTKNKWYWKT